MVKLPAGHHNIDAHPGTSRIWDAASGTEYATFISLADGGSAALFADGGYNVAGDLGDRAWWAIKLCRFGPGELDPYVPEIRRLPDNAPGS